MIPLGEAWSRMFAEAHPLPAERAALAEAVGRALAEPVVAPVDLPPFDRTAMDGWVIGSLMTSGPPPYEFAVDGDLAAGDAAGAPLARGHARRISTGAPLPPGGDAIVRLEDGEERDGVLRTRLPVPAGRHVRRRGEDVAAGSVLLDAGAPVDAGAIPLLASSGVAEVAVPRRARIALVATGSELVRPGRPLPPGAVYESNLAALAALAPGAEDLGIVPDDPEATRTLLERGAGADVLAVTGGVSVGPHDHVRPALDALGMRELFWRVNLKPGKPVLCGRLGDTWVLGLPGNPLSTVVGWLLFGAPLVARLHGHPAGPPAFLPARLAADAGPADGRHTLLTAVLRIAPDGALEAEPTAAQGSHLTATLAAADGLVLLERTARAGEQVRVLLLRPPR